MKLERIAIIIGLTLAVLLMQGLAQAQSPTPIVRASYDSNPYVLDNTITNENKWRWTGGAPSHGQFTIPWMAASC